MREGKHPTRFFHAPTRRGSVAVLAAAVLASVLGMAPAAHAAVPHPCNAHDLRDAVNSGAPDIVLNKKCKYVFTSADWTGGNDPDSALTVDTALSIWGNGATIEIDGPEAFRHFFVVGPLLRLNNLTLKGGSQKSPFSTSLGAGSVAMIGGDLLAEKVTWKDNEVTAIGATALALAGAILNVGGGVVELVKSTIKDNEVNAYGLEAQAAGGGVVSTAGSVVADRTTVKNNEVNASGVVSSAGIVGGIVSLTGLTMERSTVKGNKVTARGLEAIGVAGGLAIGEDSTINESEISGNRATAGGPVAIAAGGGILNGGDLVVDWDSVDMETTGKTTTIKDNKVKCESKSFCLAVGGGYTDLDPVTMMTGEAAFGTTLFKRNKAEAKDGIGAGGGLGLYGDSTLLVDATVTKNTAKGDVALGGGIANFGDTGAVNIDSSDIFKNKPEDCYNVFGC